MKKILFMMLGVLIALPAFARDFTYEYGGQRLTYTVLDENAKTCQTKNGSYQPGNEVSGNLVLPANPKDEEVEYTLTTIGSNAFRNCSGLTSVNIPESVSSIGSQAFLGCFALTSVTSFNQNPPVMNDNSFEGSYALATLNLSPEALSRYLATNWSLFENIGSMSGNVFGTYETGNLKYRLIPALTADENNLAIVIPGDYASLTEVKIPERFTVSENGSTTCYYVDAIGYKAFNSASNLTTVTFSSRNASKIIGEYAFAGTKISAISIPQSVETIHDYAFSDCTALKDVEIGSEAKTIGNYAFNKCSGLTSFNIPNSVTSIGDYALYGCSGLKTLIIEDADTELSVGNNALYLSPIENLTIGRNWTYVGSGAMSTGIKNLTLTNGVTAIPNYAFRNCSGLTSVNIPESVSFIGYQAFLGCSALTSVTSFNQNPPVMNDNSFEGRYALATLNLSPEALSRYLATNWSLFENIGSMSGNVFGTYETGNLKYRLIPALTADENNLAIVIPGDYASLTEVKIPERFTVLENGSTTRYYVDAIGYKAFNSASNLTTVTFSSRNASKIIGEYAFAGTKISAISIPQSVETIHDYAFSDCTALKDVEIGSETKTIGNYAFNKCKSLHAIHIPDKIVRIGNYAFSDCTALKDVKIGNNITSVDASYFEGCDNLSSLTIADGLNPIELSGDWKNFTNLENLTINRNFTITK